MITTDSTLRATTGDVVSQSEVESLLAEMGPRGSAAQESEAPGARSISGEPTSQSHTFPHLSRFSASELRKLRVLHEGFIRSLVARLAVYLRMEVGLQMSRIETSTFQKFLEALSKPTHLSLFKLEPLKGTCLFEIPPQLALSIVDRELGGSGVCREESRDLNQMETRLLVQFIETILSEWCSSWSDLADLRPVIVGFESSGQFLQTSPRDHTMLVLGIEMRVGERVEELQLAFPHQALEPLILKLNSGPDSSAQQVTPRAASAAKWSPSLADVHMSITATLPTIPVTARQLADLKPGDLFPISPELVRQARVCVENVPKFVGACGTIDGKWAVKIERETV